MKGVHESAIAIYFNPVFAIGMFIGLKAQGCEMSYFFDGKMGVVDWILFIALGASALLIQILKMLSMRYDKPAKLTHYTYF